MISQKPNEKTGAIRAVGSLRRLFSIIVLAIFVIAITFIQPACFCPTYYLGLGVLPVAVIVCGPLIPRILGIGGLIVSLLFAGCAEHARRDQRDRIRTQLDSAR